MVWEQSTHFRPAGDWTPRNTVVSATEPEESGVGLVNVEVLVPVLMEALMPYPEAREAVLCGLDGLSETLRKKTIDDASPGR